MEQSFTLFKVRGIRIGANWSWLFVFAFIIYTLAAAEFPRTYPGLSQASYIAMGIAAGILFVTSLLLHELGHAFTALREGMEIEGITLWLFGGVARFKGMFSSAGSEFRIAIAGPIVSAILCALFSGLTMLLNHISAPSQLVGVTHQIAFTNGLLLAFNMIPALPLDGGRVFRAYLWYRQGDFTTATISAARTARFFAGTLIAFGLLTFVRGAGFGGLWLSFIGWFLLQAAQSEAAFARLSSSLSGLHVRDVMTPEPVVVTPERTLASFIDDFAHARGHSTFPVVDGVGALDGLVSLRAAGTVPPDQRALKTVRDVMTQRGDVPVARPDDDVLDVLARLQQPPGRAVVIDNGRIVGIVSGSDIGRALEHGRLRGPGGPPGPRRPRRRSRATWIVPTVFALGVAGFFVKPPVAVLAPGTSFDVVQDIQITGVPTHHVRGKYLLTSVAVDQPNSYGFIVSFFQSREFVPISALVPRNVSPEKYFIEQKKMFEQSELVAAGAAAKAAGMPVSLSGRGARVADVVPGAPAARVLTKDDVITAVDGNPVSIAEDVGRVIRSRPAGTEFTFRIERNGQTITVKVRSRSGLADQGQPAIGILTETRDFKVQLPFKVSFRQHDIGGQSAGLAYALAIYDIIKSGELAHGRAIAATGTIDVDGHVGPIGGVKEKAAAARTAGAQLFLVPNEELPDAHGTGLSTHGVGTLQDALALLQRKA